MEDNKKKLKKTPYRHPRDVLGLVTIAAILI
jgi:hypothetical protein